MNLIKKKFNIMNYINNLFLKIKIKFKKLLQKVQFINKILYSVLKSKVIKHITSLNKMVN